jgi:glutamate-ammonia-ligase adenylyltransferase
MTDSTAPTDATAAQLHRAGQLSRYARRLLANPPRLFDPAQVSRPLDRDGVRRLLGDAHGKGEQILHQRLRHVRQAVLLQIIARDLNGLAGLDEVLATITALAEECLRFALAELTAPAEQSHGVPLGARSGTPQKLVVVGMGKLGGEELNVSSDIDLVLLYPEDGETAAARPISNQEYFTRLARRLIAALEQYTEDGLVFRVDTRLRPYGDSGPLVMSYDMLETYLHSQGREWERYAWVKARVLTEPVELELETIVAGFVYRRHLDYSAIASLRELHAQIRAEVTRRDLHDNVKLGPGGIREIEFIAQLFQLVRGGHDPALRLRSTRAALRELERVRILPSDAVADLQSAYAFLRNLEHRLQYLDDQQTQQMPAGEEEREMVARAMGCADYAGLVAALNPHRERVTRQFEAVFADKSAAESVHPLSAVWLGQVTEEVGVATLSGLGFRHPQTVLERMRSVREGQLYRRMAASTQARVDRLVPHMIEAAAATEHPDEALERLAKVLEAIGRREAYFALLLEFPSALGRLATLVAASPWATDYLAGHPMLLDELISSQAFEAPDWPGLRERLRSELDHDDGNTERQMDALRHFKQVQTMRLLVQDLAGTLPLETLSDHLSDLACVILGQVLRLAWKGVRTRHREEPRFAIIGYGKLGGKELGYASDLDLIFLYEDDHPDAAENYARLAQRINTWLTSFTAAGVLYETDLRLRPDGASGLLVSRFEAFGEYQRTKAWTFEHQALTRARFVAGDADIGRAFEALRIDLLRLPRDLRKLAQEITAMRQKMLDRHPNRSGLFDVKHDRGGIIDVEFCVQYLVLGYSHVHAELTGNIGNLALLKLAGQLGLIPAALADAAHASYREFRRLQHQVRLQGETYARVPREKTAGLVEPVRLLWATVFGPER